MRGRNRNSKGPNPLTRSYESNGPDVKIRGTAQHIADKYAQLARDAQASGDPVAAENYLQHAEHYYRIIAAAQEQFREQFGGGYQQRPFDDEGEDDGQGYGGERQPLQAGEDDMGGQPQPYVQPQPYEARSDRPESGERQDRFDRGDRQERGDRFQGRDRFDRGDRQDRGDRPGRDRFPRNDRPRQDFQRPDYRQDGGRDGNRPDDRQSGRRDRPDFRQDQPRFDRPPRPRDEAADQGPNGLPAFLTTPVRAPISVDEPEGEDAGPIEAMNGEAPGEPNGRFKTRRRRRPRPDEGGEPSADFGPEGDTPPAE
jgi:hypothetical protein